MDVIQLQRRFIDYTSSLYQEGFLDEQFMQLQQLQDESNPEFVVEVVSLFFEDAEKLLVDLSKTLAQQPVEFKKVDAHVHQFKGSSSSMGVSENFKFILLNDGNQSDQTLQRGVSTVAWDAIF